MNMPKPTKEFFETDLIAADIRTVTLDGIAGCLYRLLGRGSQEGRIMGASAKLQERGVIAGMHLIASDDPEIIRSAQLAMMASPRKAAEFVGGMFLDYLYEFNGALEMPLPHTAEEQETLTRMLAEGNLPHELRMAHADMGSLIGMERMLDRQPDELRPY